MGERGNLPRVGTVWFKPKRKISPCNVCNCLDRRTLEMAYTQREGQCQGLEEKTPKCCLRPHAKDKVVTEILLPGWKWASKRPGINTGYVEELLGTWAGHTNSPLHVCELILFTLFLLLLHEQWNDQWGKLRTDQMLCFPPFWLQLSLEDWKCQETSWSKHPSTRPQSWFSDLP